MVRGIFIALITIMIGIFAGGGIFAWAGFISVDNYAILSGITGGIASIIGLTSFVIPKFSSDDIGSIDGELLERLASTKRALEEYEGLISRNKEDFSRIEKERKELELLVREASIKVFYEERLRRIADEIDRLVSSDVRLIEYIREYREAKETVSKISGRLQESPHGETILSIVRDIEPSRRKIFIHILGVSIDIVPVLRAYQDLLKTLFLR